MSARFVALHRAVPRCAADPLDRCATGLRAVHSCAKLHRSSSELEQGGGGLEQHSMEAAAAAAAAGGGKGAAAGGMQWGAGPGPTLGEQLQHEADPRRRVVYALTKVGALCAMRAGVQHHELGAACVRWW